MSSGLDVYLEKYDTRTDEYKAQLKWLEANTRVSVSHNEQFPSDVNNKKQIPATQVELYFLRVNAKGISWGKQQQIDDNVAILYDVDNKTILRIEQL